MEAMTGNVIERYYIRVEEIWELNYSGLHSATTFCVKWAKNVQRENRHFTTMCIPDSDSGTVNAIAKNEPWVHAKHVTQCFFITDPINPSCVVVRRSKRLQRLAAAELPIYLLCGCF